MAGKTKKTENSQKFHYVYRITFIHPDRLEGPKYYYGQRTSTVPPQNDNTYMSSSLHLKKLYKNYPVQKAKLFGKECFKKKIIGCYPTKTEALAKEIQLHACFNVQDHPLFFNLSNQSSTGFTTSVKLSADQIEKIRQKARGRTHSAESRALMSKQRRNQKRTPHSQEHKQKISKGLYGHKHSPETRKKMSETRKTKKQFLSHSELTKQKISQTMKKVSFELREINQLHICPHCGVGKAPGIFSWHFTRCKYRPHKEIKKSLLQ